MRIIVAVIALVVVILPNSSAHAASKKTNGIASYSYYDSADKGSNTSVFVGPYGQEMKCSEINKSDPQLAAVLPEIKRSCTSKVTSNYPSKTKQRYHTARIPDGVKFVNGGYEYVSPDGLTTFKRDRWNGREKLKMTKEVDGETLNLKYVYFNFYNPRSARYDGNKSPQPTSSQPTMPVEQPQPVTTEPGCPIGEPCKGGDPTNVCPPEVVSCGKDGPLPPVECQYDTYDNPACGGKV